MSKVEYKAR